MFAVPRIFNGVCVYTFYSKAKTKFAIWRFSLKFMIAMAMDTLLGPAIWCLNLLWCQISCHIQLSFSIRIDSNWLTNRLFCVCAVFFVVIWNWFCVFLCLHQLIDHHRVPFVVIHTHTHTLYIYDLRRFSLNFICNGRKQSQNNNKTREMYISSSLALL